MTDTRKILQQVSDGEMGVDEALMQLKTKPFEDIGFAKVDIHRSIRQGAAEVVYGESKTPEQICSVVETLRSNGCDRVLITRIDGDKAEIAGKQLGEGFEYFPEARLATVGEFPEPDGKGTVLVVTGGTSDIPVAREAEITARFHGNRVESIYDVGVAGIHRLLSYSDKIMEATVVVAVAGMEGALASVLGGLTDRPVIAVPTSVGYGTAFGGLTALLSMLNSCASGVSVVNIDNGFGAGYLAGMINHT
ncbi:MAG: nickel pincer cofactor biosynthesis protein LarB [Lentihominibacter sp.]